MNVDMDMDIGVASAAIGDSSRLPARKILILDDDSFFRELVKRLLTAGGYETLEARSTAEADALLCCKPDLAIIDYRLPGSDGAVYIESLRQRGCNFPIVFCSGSTYSQQTLATVRNLLGVDLILRKPIDANDFLEHIQSLLPVPEEQPAQYIEDDSSATESSENQYLTASEDCLNDDYRESQPAPNDETATTLAMLADLSKEYISELPSMIGAIQTDFNQAMRSLEKEQFESVSEMAHRIRGTAGSFGLVEVSRIAGLLEDTLAKEVLCDNINDEEKNGGDATTQNNILELIESLDNAVIALTSPPDDFTPEENIESSDIQSYEVATVEYFAAPTDVIKILVVSADDQQLQDIGGKLSEISEHHLQVAQNAIDVFPLLNAFTPDVILIDAELPNICGNDLCRMIRCNPKWADVTIIIITDDCSYQSRSKLFENGASDFLLLPIVKKELDARLRMLTAN